MNIRLVILAAILISAPLSFGIAKLGEHLHRHSSVTCDSGFTIGRAHIAYMDDGGVIKWQQDRDGGLITRKMLSGEVCAIKKEPK